MCLLTGCLSLMLVAGTAGAQSVSDVRDHMLRGNYDEAIRTAQQMADARGNQREDWRMLLIESLLAVGRYPEAYTNAALGVAERSDSIGMRLLARDAALYNNDFDAANRLLIEIRIRIEQRPPYSPNGDELVALGRALLSLGV
ncbi:MAG TPA: hypothetical protein PKA41_20245, partial [Verrucomicrobiota bacterium]|nr:hypothetical protein [Verrucomicrobiota bacterium]